MRAAAKLARATAIVVGGTVLGPRSALACAVCFGDGTSDWNGAFLFGTVLMLALPPAIIVGAGIAIYRGMKRQEARIRERDAQRAQPPVQQGAS